MKYIGVIIIGIGFIIMAAGNILKSELASMLQAILGVAFIILAIKRIIEEHKKNK